MRSNVGNEFIQEIGKKRRVTKSTKFDMMPLMFQINTKFNKMKIKHNFLTPKMEDLRESPETVIVFLLTCANIFQECLS